MKEKKVFTPEETYKKNQKKAKIVKILCPVVYFGLLGLAVLSLVLAFKNSFGNIAEIIELLDDQKFTGEQLNINYQYLVGKYGEWKIGSVDSIFAITFVNLKNALFSGLMITNCVMFVLFFVSAIVLGKFVLPRYAEQIIEDNQDMVNLTILKQTENKGE
jgi:hypothetical protein